MRMLHLIVLLGVYILNITIASANQDLSVVESSDPVKQRVESNDPTTHSGMLSIVDNRKKPDNNKTIAKKPFLERHTCPAMGILSCECYLVRAPFILTSDLLVNCSNRKLSFVPVDIPSNTVVLILSLNKIEKIPIDVFKNLTRLTKLDLSSNAIAAFEDGIFTGLNSLENLDLHDNPFKLVPSVFGDNVFSPLTSLRELNLKSSRSASQSFIYPDTALGKLISLQTLIIDGLNNTTFREGFQNMTSLNTLDLSLSPAFQFISNDTFLSFQNIQVKNLLLNNCSLTWIHTEALQHFPKIDTIDYSHNFHLEIAGVGNSCYGLQNTTIRKIIMQQVHSGSAFANVKKQDLIYLVNTNLEELYLDLNNIALFDNDALLNLPRSLKIVSVSWNIILTTAPQLMSLLIYRNITEVNFSHQMATQSSTNNDIATHITESTVADQLSFINPDNNGFKIISHGLNITSFDHIKRMVVNIPPKLWNVQCSYIGKLSLWIPEFTLLNASITHADFSYNQLKRWVGPIFGIEKLLHLNLSGNECDFVSPQLFGCVPNLQTLRIAQNRFGPELEENMFYNMTSLRILDMHRNLIEKTSPTLFSRLVELQQLDISSNYLTSWEADITSLVNLSRMNLSNNKLSTMPTKLRDGLDILSKINSIEVDISGNPFDCICETEDFLLWFTHTKLSFFNLTSTVCKLKNETKVSLTRSNEILKHLQNNCRSYTILIVVTSVIGGLSLVILIGFMIHRYRWKIRYLLYVNIYRKERSGYQRLEVNQEESQYFYDAFISYEDESRPFIINEVIPRLESGIGIKLCIDKRDFVPGLEITDNIMHAIRNSRNTVVLLTKEFLKSKWCMYELNMARMEAIYNESQSLIVVVLEDMPNKSLPRDILDIFRQQTYIEMVGDEYGAELFWYRLTSAIKLEC